MAQPGRKHKIKKKKERKTPVATDYKVKQADLSSEEAKVAGWLTNLVGEFNALFTDPHQWHVPVTDTMVSSPGQALTADAEQHHCLSAVHPLW